jgi:adenylate cyclase
VLFRSSGDIERAIISGREAVNGEPNDADSAALLALTMIYAGEPQHAILLLSRAMKLKPYPPRWYYWLDARAHRHAGKFDDAIRILTSDESGGGRSPLPTVELLLAYAESGALDDARQVAQDIRRQFPEFVAAQWGRVPAYRNPDRRRRDLAALAAAGLDVSEPVR